MLERLILVRISFDQISVVIPNLDGKGRNLDLQGTVVQGVLTDRRY